MRQTINQACKQKPAQIGKLDSLRNEQNVLFNKIITYSTDKKHKQQSTVPKNCQTPKKL